MADKTPRAFVRDLPLAHRGELRRAEHHGKGGDRSARGRRRADADARCLALGRLDDDALSAPRIVYPDGHPKANPDHAPVMDLVGLYDGYVKRLDIRRRRGTKAIGQHLIVGVSSQYFQNPDDRHDPASPAVRDLTRLAAEWAEGAIGGVIHARYDVDENGSAVVDVFVVPTRVDKRTGRRWISTAAPQRKLRKKWKRWHGYSAYQDDWAEFITARTGREFLRGKPKRETRREHVTAEEYGAAMDAGRRMVAELNREQQDAQGALAKLKAQIDGLRGAVERLRGERDALRAQAVKEQSRLKRFTQQLQVMRKDMTGFANQAFRWGVGHLRMNSRPDLPPDPEPGDPAGMVQRLASLAAIGRAALWPDQSFEEHFQRAQRVTTKRLREGGWGEDHPEAPLHRLYKVEYPEHPPDSPDPYYDWRLELAHSSGRRTALVERAAVSNYALGDLKDCIALARRIERRDGRYMTRRERREAIGDAAESMGRAAASPRRRGSGRAGFSR